MICFAALPMRRQRWWFILDFCLLVFAFCPLPSQRACPVPGDVAARRSSVVLFVLSVADRRGHGYARGYAERAGRTSFQPFTSLNQNPVSMNYKAQQGRSQGGL